MTMESISQSQPTGLQEYTTESLLDADKSLQMNTYQTS